MTMTRARLDEIRRDGALEQRLAEAELDARSTPDFATATFIGRRRLDDAKQGPGRGPEVEIWLDHRNRPWQRGVNGGTWMAMFADEKTAREEQPTPPAPKRLDYSAFDKTPPPPPKTEQEIDPLADLSPDERRIAQRLLNLFVRR